MIVKGHCVSQSVTKGIEKQTVWSKYKNKAPSPIKNTTPTLPQKPLSIFWN